MHSVEFRKYINIVDQSYGMITEDILMEDFDLKSLYSGLHSILGNKTDSGWSKIMSFAKLVANMLRGLDAAIIKNAFKFLIWCLRNKISAIYLGAAIIAPKITATVTNWATSSLEASAKAAAFTAHAASHVASAWESVKNAFNQLIGNDDAVVQNTQAITDATTWDSVAKAAEFINHIVGKTITPENLEALSNFVVHFAVPAIFVAGILSVGVRLVDLMMRLKPPPTTVKAVATDLESAKMSAEIDPSSRSMLPGNLSK